MCYVVLVRKNPGTAVALLVLSAPSCLWAQQPQIVSYVSPHSSSAFGATTLGTDGNLWFADSGANAVGYITPAGTITEYTLPTGNSGPSGVAVGPDGNLWFTESRNNKIGKITTAGAITEYSLPTAGASPGGIALGPDGSLWFLENYTLTLPFRLAVAKIAPGGAVTEYAIPNVPIGALEPFLPEIVAGPDGNLWFTSSFGYVGKVTTAGAITTYPLADASPEILDDWITWGITSGSDGALWFTDFERVWRMTTAGTPTLVYSLPTSDSNPLAIVQGPDGAFWVTESQANKIARVTPGGIITEYSLPNGLSGPGGITQGSDGNIWFTAQNAICKIILSTVPAVIAPVVSPASLTFTQVILGPTPPNQSVTASVVPNQAYSVSSTYVYGPKWLQVSPSGPLTGAQILTVSVSTNDVDGVTFGDIWITSGSVTEEVPVSLSIVAPPPPTAGSITVSVSSLTFSYVTGTAASSQKFSVTGASNGEIPVTVSVEYGVPPAPGWLSLANAQGTTLLNGSPVTTPAQLTAGINLAGLVPGTYNATIILTPSGSSAVSIPVSLTITAGSTVISLSPSSLSFVYQPNSGVNGVPAPQAVAVTVSGASNASFSVQEASFLGWVGEGPSSGTAPGSFSVAVSPINSAPGIYTSSFTVTLPQTNPVVTTTLPVTLTITGPPGVTQFAATPGPAESLTPGPDGAMWFTEPTLGRIGRITPGGSVTEFPLPAVNPQPGPMALGPDGNLWFAEASPARIAKMTTTGAVTEFNLPVSGTSVAGITVGPDGNLWFTEYNENKIGKTTPSGSVTEYALGSLAEPSGITKGSDGNVWFTETGLNKIAKMTTSGVITEYVVPSALIGALVTGPDGNIWFPEWDLGSVGKMTPTGSITQYAVGPFSGAIAVGSDGNLWMGDLSYLASVSPNGSSNTVFLSPAADIFDVTSGVDGNLWFTDSEGIARYTLNKGTLGIASVVSAASFQGSGVAPGEIITVGGTNFGLAAPLGLSLDPDGKVATSLGGLTVSINGFYAPLLYASATQINCIVPYALAGSGGDAELAVTSAGLFDSIPVALAQAAPGIFTAAGSGSGNAAILNADGSYNSSQNPAPQGSIITFYLTGEGQTNPAGVTGSVTAPNTSGSGPLTPQPALPVSVTIGGTPAPIAFLGEAPGLVAGVMQINAQVPTGIASGNVPLVVSIGGVASQGNVTAAVK